MMNERQLFLNSLAQTSNIPLMLNIKRAEGIYLFDDQGKKYLDLISGISVSNLGHHHPEVVDVIKKQVDEYLYTMVYGEFVLSPQVRLASFLNEIIPSDENWASYFVNSGSEAIEGAMKLAKRFTGRNKILAFRNGYHGSTQGALSLMSDEGFKRAFRPLLPGIEFMEMNKEEDLDKVDSDTAAVVMETIQGEAGVIQPDPDFMKLLRKRTKEKKALLILDEIQSGVGRTGKMFAFEHFGILPDIFTLAKGFGGGMPLGAFIAPGRIMSSLSENPVLGHITTFGGHPVSCVAGLKTLEIILKDRLMDQVENKEKLFIKHLQHPAIREIRSKGLFMAVELDSFENVRDVIHECIGLGMITDWFLHNPKCFRIAPPLTINEGEITEACSKINKALGKVYD